MTITDIEKTLKTGKDTSYTVTITIENTLKIRNLEVVCKDNYSYVKWPSSIGFIDDDTRFSVEKDILCKINPPQQYKSQIAEYINSLNWNLFD